MLNAQVTLKEFASLIETCGSDVTILGRGEPGIGKSSVFHRLKESSRFKGYAPLYLDCALLDVGDLQIPFMQDGKYAFLPNAMFVNEVPMLIMLEEIGKAPRAVKNALLPMLNGEKRIGNFRLHPDTVVFGTTNLSTDGVGDIVEAHAKSRVCEVHVSKPTADELVLYGTDNGFDPSVLAWIKHFPHALASYTDDGFDESNPYAYNPRRQQAAYVTPRTVEKSSHVAKQRHLLTPQAFICALTGLVGESAARDMNAFFSLGDAMPEWVRVITHPDTCPVPEDMLTQTLLVFSAVQRLDKASVTPWLTYAQRLHKEAQALFTSQCMASNKASLLVTNRLFTAWATENNWLY